MIVLCSTHCLAKIHASCYTSVAPKKILARFSDLAEFASGNVTVCELEHGPSGSLIYLLKMGDFS